MFILPFLNLFKKQTWFCFIVLLLCISKNVATQSFIGVSNSSYGALYGSYDNPSKLMYSKNKKELQILSGDYRLFNNFYSLKTIWSAPFTQDGLSGIIKNNTSKKFPDISSTVNLSITTDLHLVNFYRQYQRSNKWSFAFSVGARYRSLTDFQNVDRNVFQLFEQSISTNINNDILADKIKNYIYTQNNLQYLQHNFAEVSLSFAADIINNSKYTLVGGITVKRLLGIYYESFSSKNLTTAFFAPPYRTENQLRFKGDLEFSAVNQDFKNKQTGINQIFPIGNIFSSDGTGWGTDIGFSLEVPYGKYKLKTPSDSSSFASYVQSCYKKYKYKFSASLIDFGYITYQSGSNTTNFLSVKDSARLLNWNRELVGKTNSYDALRSTFLNASNYTFYNGETIQTLSTSRSILLPVRLHLDFDLPLRFMGTSQLWTNMFFNFAYNQNVFGIYQLFFSNPLGNKSLSNVILETRYQTKNFDISFPVTAYVQSVPLLPFFNLGVGARYKHFIFGTNNIGSLIGIFNFQTVNIYAGVNYLVPYACSNVPPLEEVLDSTSKRLLGFAYKDSDGDKVPDHKDKCPLVFGEISNFGCPIDPDSLLNSKINQLSIALKFIPEKSILQPSSDKVLDKIKALLKDNPKLKVLIAGKPDSSTNREYNANLKLALQRDSVLQEEFKARGIDSSQVTFISVRPEQTFPSHIPIMRKLVEGKDEDRDGVYDIDDRCPLFVGSNYDEGCTFIDEENASLATTSLGSKVEFWKGLKNFAYSSEQNLDEVAGIMKKAPEIKVLVRGFVGREILQPDYKYELSQKRADTIKQYLMYRGIHPDRIIALGMSPYEPYHSVPVLVSLLDRENMDTDYDGVLDITDRCPTLKGISQYDGCPDYTTLKQYIYIDSLSQINIFEKDVDNFNANAGAVLLSVKKYLDENPDKTLAISPGIISTELTGEQKNALSQARAMKIKSYLTSLGIDENRLIARGLGYQQPLDAINTFMIINSRLIDGDNDNVRDYEDKCPTVRGTISNYGCPQVNEEDADLLVRINRGLQFEPNTSKLTVGSVPYLDSLLFFMAVNPNSTIVTSGNVANAELDCQKQNKINQERAELIRNYLILYGVSKNRVTAVGLSCLEEKPWLTPSVRVVDNLTDIDNDLTKEVYDKCPNTVGSTFNYGCPYQLDKINKQLKDISDNLLFDLNQFTLKPKTIKALKKLATLLFEDHTLVIIASGHADTTGTKENNEVLSLKRAASVKKYLLQQVRKKERISSDRIIVIGLGDKFPIADNKTEYGREQNRRVSIFLIQ